MCVYDLLLPPGIKPGIIFKVLYYNLLPGIIFISAENVFILGDCL